MPGSFSWAITDRRYERQPWRHETFSGYFTDIRRAARKSLPRRPNKDLCNILGLTLAPQRLECDARYSDRRYSGSALSVANTPVSLTPVVIRTADRPPDTLAQQTQGSSDKLKNALLCRMSKNDDCSKRERTVFGCAVYFAIIIFILLIVVLVLSATLSSLSDDDASDQVELVTATRVPATTLFKTSLSNGPRTPEHTVKETSHSITKITSKSPSLPQGSTESPKSTSPTQNRFETTVHATEGVSTIARSSSLSVLSLKTFTSSKTTDEGPATTDSVSSIFSTIRTETSDTSSRTSQATSFSSQLSLSISTSTASVASSSVISTALSKASSLSVPTQTSNSVMPTVTTRTESPKTSISTQPSSFTRLDSTAVTSDRTTKSLTAATSEPTLSPSSTTPDAALLPTLEHPDITCTSSKCLAANKTMSRIDLTKSPCVDFYEFACGKWSREWKDKDEKGRVRNIPGSVQEEMRQGLLLDVKGILEQQYREDESFSAKVSKRLFQSCMASNEGSQIVLGEISHSQTMQEVHELLDPLGMKADGTIQNTLDALLKEAVTRFQVTPFFKMSPVTTLNEDGIKENALQIEPPTVFLDQDAYRQPVEDGKRSFKYVEGLTKVLYSYLTSFRSRRKRQTDESSISSLGFDELFDNVLRIYYIEANITSILENITTRGDVWYNTLQYTYSEVRVLYRFIDWASAIGQERDFLVKLVHFEYFQALNGIWRRFNQEDVKLFVFMHVLVHRVWPYMKLPFRQMLSNISSNDNMVYSELDCVNIALDLAGEEIHALYIGQYTPNVLNNRLKLTDLKNKVNEAFQKYLSAPNWIQPDLERAVTSLARIVKMHFSPIRTNVRQTKNITGSTQSLLSLSVELHRQKYEVQMNRLGSEISEIVMDWTSTRPLFDEDFNAIGLPTGLTIYLNNADLHFDFYGYVGMLMAEEVIKVLTGPMRGGVPPQWWGSNNLIAFSTVLQCFNGQLSTLQNSVYDLGNVMITNGAFQLIDQVYFSSSPSLDTIIPGSTVSENMLFAINVAQLHCQVDDGSYERRIVKERLNNVMMNNVNFKQMFSCPDISPMVGKDTCSLFS